MWVAFTWIASEKDWYTIDEEHTITIDSEKMAGDENYLNKLDSKDSHIQPYLKLKVVKFYFYNP